MVLQSTVLPSVATGSIVLALGAGAAKTLIESQSSLTDR